MSFLCPMFRHDPLNILKLFDVHSINSKSYKSNFSKQVIIFLCDCVNSSTQGNKIPVFLFAISDEINTFLSAVASTWILTGTLYRDYILHIQSGWHTWSPGCVTQSYRSLPLIANSLIKFVEFSISRMKRRNDFEQYAHF